MCAGFFCSPHEKRVQMSAMAMCYSLGITLMGTGTKVKN